jgi:hypothetical protein
VITVQDGVEVQVSGIAMPPEGYGIVGANVYRAATGARDADGKVQKPLSGWLFVRVRAAYLRGGAADGELPRP